MTSFKLETKEKFHVATPETKNLSAALTEQMTTQWKELLHQNVKNLIINMRLVENSDPESLSALLALQQEFNASEASFVVCALSPAILSTWKPLEDYDLLNSTPTESEAWDIVQMEEIERELLNGLDD